MTITNSPLTSGKSRLLSSWSPPLSVIAGIRARVRRELPSNLLAFAQPRQVYCTVYLLYGTALPLKVTPVTVRYVVSQNVVNNSFKDIWISFAMSANLAVHPSSQENAGFTRGRCSRTRHIGRLANCTNAGDKVNHPRRGEPAYGIAEGIPEFRACWLSDISRNSRTGARVIA